VATVWWLALLHWREIFRLPACSSDPHQRPARGRADNDEQAGRNGPYRTLLRAGSPRKQIEQMGVAAARSHIHGVDLGGGEAFALIMAHEPPGDPLVRALPSPAKQTFGCLALSWEALLNPCLAEPTLDGTETGHSRDAERDEGGRRGGHLPWLMATPSLLSHRPGQFVVRGSRANVRDHETPNRQGRTQFVLEAPTAAACSPKQ
jgi:hypothetical protein